jgi:hypothetical protein
MKTEAMGAGVVYDAVTISRILGISTAYRGPVPHAVDGQIVVYYGGWDLQTLRKTAAGNKRMWQDQEWYDEKAYTAEPGYYRVFLPVPDSNGRTWSEQISDLRTFGEAWQPAPVVVAATALLVHMIVRGTRLVENQWFRCAEVIADGYHVQLAVDASRVDVAYDWDGHKREKLWLTAYRKIWT